jgi:putative transposase
VIRAYLFALDPAAHQTKQFRSHCGAQRVAYNWCLAQVRANWAQRAAEQTYGLTGDQLTPWINTSAYSLRKAWNATKEQVAPWWSENSKEAYASGCANLATALGNRKAGRTRMPRFKSKHRARLTCRFTTGSFGLGPDRRHVQLPVIGLVRTHESTRKLARHLEAGTARIRSVTLSHQRGRWHVAFSVEMPDREPVSRSGRVVGVDLGIKSLAVLSTGEVVGNPRHLGAALTDLRRAQRQAARRQGPDRRTRATPSNRWRKARARADRVHTRVGNLRRNAIHQLTNRLVGEFDTIVIEDLHVTGMVRNRSLARHIADASWAEIRRQLTYKSERAGCALIVADRWFASSKTCSRCGTAKAKLMLSERTYVCTACGLILDRDHNAARNLAALAADTGELRREQPEGTDVRPARLAGQAVGLPREEPFTAQRYRREAVAR